MGIRRNETMELPSLDSLPHTTCWNCGGSKINGLFQPAELRKTNPHCMKCVGDISEKQRIRKKEGW